MRPQRGAAVRCATRDGHLPCCRAVARRLAARQASRVSATRQEAVAGPASCPPSTEEMPMICPSNGIRSRLVFACAVALTLTLAGAAAANPRDIPAGAKLVYNFEVLGYRAGQTYNGGCGNGHRIFVNREANSAHILVTNGSFWTVLDCNATSDHQAMLQSSQVGIYDVYTRILGK